LAVAANTSPPWNATSPAQITSYTTMESYMSGDPISAAMQLRIAAAQLRAAAREAEIALHMHKSASSAGQQPAAPSSPRQSRKEKKRCKTQARLARGESKVKADTCTTVMLRNIPNDYTRDALLSLLDSEGFAGCYDFIYVTVDFHRWTGLGYAFLNMLSNADAVRLQAHFTGFNRWKVGSQKICEVCWGEPLQGLLAHTERYRNSPIMHEDVPDKYKPALFCAGKRVPFPPPTKRVHAPRVKPQ